MCKVSALGSSLLLAFWGTIELMKLPPVELVFSLLFRDPHGHLNPVTNPALLLRTLALGRPLGTEATAPYSLQRPAMLVFVFLSTSKPLCSRACSRHSIPRKSGKSRAFFFAQSAGQLFEC
jgi:hypothetical protein